MLVLFDDGHPGAFGHHEAIAVFIKWPAGAGRIVVAGRQGTHPGKPREAHRRHGRLAAAHDTDIGLAMLNPAEGITDGIRGAGTRGGDGAIGTFEAEEDREVPAGRVDHQFGNHERRDAVGAAIEQHAMLLLDLVQTADSAARHHTVAVRIARGEVDSRLLDRLDPAIDGELHEPVHLLGVATGDQVGGVEILDFTAKRDLELGRVEPLDRANAAFAGAKALPEFARLLPEGSDDRNSSDDDTPGHPVNPAEKRRMGKESAKPERLAADGRDFGTRSTRVESDPSGSRDWLATRGEWRTERLRRGFFHAEATRDGEAPPACQPVTSSFRGCSSRHRRWF